MKRFLISIIPIIVVFGIIYFSLDSLTGKFIEKSPEDTSKIKNILEPSPEISTLMKYQITAISNKVNTRITIIGEDNNISANCVSNVKINNETVEFSAEDLSDNIVLITVNKTYRAHIMLEANVCGDHIKSLVNLVTV